MRSGLRRAARPLLRAAADRLHGPRYLRARRAISRLEAHDLGSGYRGTRRRVLVLYDPNAIALSQVHPFLDWRRIAGAGDLDIELKAAELPAHFAAHAASGLKALPDADTVIFQPDLVRLGDTAPIVAPALRDRYPHARLVLLDGTPHSGFLGVEGVVDAIDAYVKKSSLADRAAYARPVLGDTVLTDYFARRHDCPLPEATMAVPDRFWAKLIVGPAFITDRRIMPLFARPFAEIGGQPRTIDLNARIAKRGAPWYAAMRSDADERAGALEGIAIARGQGLKLKAFMAELRQSKCTFSPFGYGELCWRDYEAMAMGSVVIKQGMDGFVTAPDLFDRDETYVPVAWDLSDFEERTRAVLADEDRRQAIAARAYGRARDYLFGGGLGAYLRQVVQG
ncbi:glycosyltransferase [Edaphosphingomonas haloaromaticamans]|uniref:Glycosyl transferases group 1 n=1 Tax=Edaphosphingomonas haloaromaticamans TaxID=653954 RepID=A0A1S1HI99_9SPHN|nr:glycosyltransferase [Sphingomonas haloaromaticamans]OHT21562.1 hypothetical protein BHE75_03571 [Sphingomonas haloaromaticamans]